MFPVVACCVAISLLVVGRPAAAVMVHGDASAARGARKPGTVEAASVSSTNREGTVQAIDPKAQSITINGTRYLIGPPQLALVDKRPKTDGLLKLAGVKPGMAVRYRLAKTPEGDRVMELWVMRDPPRAPVGRP